MLVGLQLVLASPDTVTGLTDVDEQAERCRRTAAQFRQGIAHLAGGVTVVTSGGDDGAWYGVTTTSACALSADPPTLIACVPRQSGVGQQLGRTRRFCLNLLSHEQRTVAEAFAARDSLDPDRFRHGQWVSGTAGSPVLRDGIASFECGVDLMYSYPSHLVVIGSVEHVRHGAGPASPLVSFAGLFGHVMAAVP